MAVVIGKDLNRRIKVIDIRKDTYRGRVGNFDSEVRTIREAVFWIEKNRVKSVLIRSDSSAAIQRVKNTGA